MAEKRIKTKDMIIAIFCTLLTVLGIVFYFLPAFSVEHSASLGLENSQTVYYSAWEITKSLFITAKEYSSPIIGLLFIKDVFGFPMAISGILMPLGLVCSIATTVFSYLSWFKGEKFKKYCFLFSLCGMIFTTITMISTWYIAIQLRNGATYIEYFNANMKGSISYGSFVNLILSFVIAIIACAYNYFLDNFDDDEDEEDDNEEEEEEIVEEIKEVKKESVKKEVVKDAKENSVKKSVTSTKPKTSTKAKTSK